MLRTCAITVLLMLCGASAASAQDDRFIGDWKLDAAAGTPWATGEQIFSVTSTTASDVAAFANSFSGPGSDALKGGCLGTSPGAPKAATTFYSATYTWSGGGTVKGCVSPSDGVRNLYGPGKLNFRESTNKATETALAGLWNDNTSPQSSGGWIFTAKRINATRCGARRAHAAAVNEVRVVAVQPDVQFHKAGTPEEDWRDACKDTVLQQ